MYVRPQPWVNTGRSATGATAGYQENIPGANQPNSSNGRTVPGNQTFSPSGAQIFAQAQESNVESRTNPAQQPENGVSNAAAQKGQHDNSVPEVNAHEDSSVQASAGSNSARKEFAQPEGQDFISSKIWKVNGRDKVIDFNAKLTMAHLKDFANIHGCGGSDHAGNSTIGLVICDYTKGTGKNSVTVTYNLDVEEVGFLYEAAMHARLGLLKPDPGINTAWINEIQQIVDGWKIIPKQQDGTRAIPASSLNAINNELAKARAATNVQLTTPFFSHNREKNNPYGGSNGVVPCSKLQINYTPYRKDGAPSNYPWYIGIENFDAPLKTGRNGASSHNSNQAVNKKSAFINLSNDDFCNTMVAIQRFVGLWEHRAIPMIDEAYRRKDIARAEKQRAAE